MEKAIITRHDFFRLLGTSFGVVLLTQWSMACAEKGGEPTPVNSPTVDFTLRLADKGNENLTIKGGYVVANNIMVAQTRDGKFIAVSADCTCARPGTQLVYKAADNQFYCPQHLSRFDSSGKVLMGPATQSLVQYVTTADSGAGTVRVHA